MEEKKKEQSNAGEGNVTTVTSIPLLVIEQEAEVRIIFDVVEEIIVAAQNVVEEKLRDAVRLIGSMEEGVEREKKITFELDDLYGTALANFEMAKAKIEMEWRQVKLSRNYALYLGYDKKIQNVKVMLSKWKRLQDEIKNVDQHYDTEIENCDKELSEYEKNEKIRLGIDERLEENKKERDAVMAMKTLERGIT